MSEKIELELSDEAAAEVASRASNAGVSREDWLRLTVDSVLGMDDVRRVRERILKKLEARGERYTDEDIFKMVS
jgi:hypothetical protein